MGCLADLVWEMDAPDNGLLSLAIHWFGMYCTKTILFTEVETNSDGYLSLQCIIVKYLEHKWLNPKNCKIPSHTQLFILFISPGLSVYLFVNMSVCLSSLAFNTSTGMPYGTVNLRHGIPLSETSVTCTAGCGTFILEFGTISILTGKFRIHVSLFHFYWSI